MFFCLFVFFCGLYAMLNILLKTISIFSVPVLLTFEEKRVLLLAWFLSPPVDIKGNFSHLHVEKLGTVIIINCHKYIVCLALISMVTTELLHDKSSPSFAPPPFSISQNSSIGLDIQLFCKMCNRFLNCSSFP